MSSTAPDDSDTFSESEWTDDSLDEEWQENVRQLELLVSVVVLPFFGKWLGKKWGYWCTLFVFIRATQMLMKGVVHARYMRVGLGKAFFFGV